MSEQVTFLRKLKGVNAIRFCVEKRCANRTAHRNTRCPKCARAKWRKANPEKYYWGEIRRRAKKKGREFSLYPFERFKLYLEGHNFRFGLDSIDRVDVTKGYRWDNIQVLTLRDNIAKGNRERHQLYEEEPF